MYLFTDEDENGLRENPASTSANLRAKTFKKLTSKQVSISEMKMRTKLVLGEIGAFMQNFRNLKIMANNLSDGMTIDR